MGVKRLNSVCESSVIQIEQVEAAFRATYDPIVGRGMSKGYEYFRPSAASIFADELPDYEVGVQMQNPFKKSLIHTVIVSCKRFDDSLSITLAITPTPMKAEKQRKEQFFDALRKIDPAISVSESKERISW